MSSTEKDVKHFPDPCPGCFQEQDCKEANAKCEIWFDWAKHEGKIIKIKRRSSN